MDISTYSTHEQLRRLAPGLSLGIARRRYTETLKTKHRRVLCHTRKGKRLNLGLRVNHATRQRKAHTFRIEWDPDEREDGRRLASDPTVALPGEGYRNTPRLERQEAFHAPKTWHVSDTDVVVNDAELYRLGILYDDDEEIDHVHGSGFSLDAIVHPAPVYSLRPAKRVKRNHDHRLPSLKEEDLRLSVELLSAYLGDDAAIARFFSPVSDEERARLYHGNFNGIDNEHNGLTERVGSSEPLTVIYELLESSTHALPPAASDFPDLVSDREEEGGEEYEEDSNFGDDWALVLGPSATFSPDTGHAAVGVGVDADDDEETATAADDAWVVLAGDDS
ncbi:hypothetical protein HD806DRAFT_31162 [Xylariaceae sp. AK1471]|nr:hypothetical protein HD806DRAFT_31162 [Xylariaceae sp. AK1471]